MERNPPLIITADSIQAQPLSRQFLAYAEAYLDTANCQCTHFLNSPGTFNYAHGAAVMFLTFHGIELFFKSAILEKVSQEDFRMSGQTHNLQQLKNRYETLYPSKAHKFLIPWDFDDPEYENLLDPVVAAAIRKKAAEQPTPVGEVNRYPADRKAQPWRGHFGFIPVEFLHALSAVQAEVNRLKPLLFP